MNEQEVRIPATEGQSVGDLGSWCESSSYVLLGGEKRQGIPGVRGGQYGGQCPREAGGYYLKPIIL